LKGDLFTVGYKDGAAFTSGSYNIALSKIYKIELAGESFYLDTRNENLNRVKLYFNSFNSSTLLTPSEYEFVKPNDALLDYGFKKIVVSGDKISPAGAPNLAGYYFKCTNGGVHYYGPPSDSSISTATKSSLDSDPKSFYDYCEGLKGSPQTFSTLGDYEISLGSKKINLADIPQVPDVTVDRLDNGLCTTYSVGCPITGKVDAYIITKDGLRIIYLYELGKDSLKGVLRYYITNSSAINKGAKISEFNGGTNIQYYYWNTSEKVSRFSLDNFVDTAKVSFEGEYYDLFKEKYSLSSGFSCSEDNKARLGSDICKVYSNNCPLLPDKNYIFCSGQHNFQGFNILFSEYYFEVGSDRPYARLLLQQYEVEINIGNYFPNVYPWAKASSKNVYVWESFEERRNKGAWPNNKNDLINDK